MLGKSQPGGDERRYTPRPGAGRRVSASNPPGTVYSGRGHLPVSWRERWSSTVRVIPGSTNCIDPANRRIQFGELESLG